MSEKKDPPLPPIDPKPETQPEPRVLNEGTSADATRRKAHDKKTVWRNVNDGSNEE